MFNCARAAKQSLIGLKESNIEEIVEGFNRKNACESDRFKYEMCYISNMMLDMYNIMLGMYNRGGSP